MRSLAAFLLAGCAFVPVSATAQADMAELERRIAAMQAEIARLSAEVADLRVEGNVPAPAPDPVPTAEPPVKVEWKGAPTISAEGGWSFKPRGRVQIDSAVLALPDAVPAGDSRGIATEFRRVYLGVEGSLPGNFGYRLEADFADSGELTDAYLTWKPAKGWTLTLGHHKTFNGLDDQISDLFTSMLERGTFVSAFGFERRVGLSGTYSDDNLTVQLGAFTDDADSLGDDGNNSFSVDGRVVFSPKAGAGRLHIGGSAHLRELNDAAGTVRYRARPFVHTTDLRLVDTGELAATGERNFGLELAYTTGPFHAVVEGHRMTTVRPGLPNPTFLGGYAEVGILLTPGDTPTYKGAIFDRIRPANPVSEGGIGAIQLNARYDRIDLNSGAVVGGVQQAAGLSLIWIPVDYVRFLLNYGHLWVSDARIPAGADSSYQADTVGLRAQFDF